ncbi:MAG TPA: hypothetical protein PLF32_06775 [Bacteroidales bacterium]|nr:hypothetical protein [Bacteroidales bacterium]HON20481.1 hypothetical protein [Bacteroidales bacterium]HOR82342.1 hypothetical protein [Bacteroidales bacterium]HPJ91572.1 hypothetical protein [Bacteroidales bacterium]HQB20395.1 hypothetical protein [Bacteroidales bacterium]
MKVNNSIKAFTIMLVTVLSLGFIFACEKKEKEDILYLNGTWKCTDNRYTQTGYLKITFNNDTTISAENTTLKESLFDNVSNSHYEIKKDSMLYIILNNTSPLEFILYQLSSNSIKLLFTGGVIQDANAPSGIYEFEKEGGVK